MMAKKISILLGAIAAITVLGIGIYHSDASQKSQEMTEKEISELIESQYPGEITKLDLKQDAYQATIKSDVAEYELQLDAKSGEIQKIKETRTLAAKDEQEDKENTANEEKSKDQGEKQETSGDKSANKKEDTPKTSIEKKEKSEEQSNSETKDKQVSEKKPKKEKEKKTVISRDEAIEIALAQFSGEVDDVDLEEEDGRLIYEIEIERDDQEAEIEIDAYTGEVIVMEIDD